ncbi:MAG: glycosyltransferase family 4 protein [Bacteroidia bacterium]|nr:glycosyltransferase family 4 protein [Bacteroidia bacterium]
MKVGFVVDNDFINDGRVFKEVSILIAKYEVKTLCLNLDKNTVSDSRNIHSIYLSKWTKNKLFALASWLPLYKWIWAKAIREFINKEDIQLLHVHDLYMAPPAIDAIKNSQRPVKLVLDLHENFPASVLTYNWTKGFFKNLITRPRDWAKKENDILRSVDRIITLSNDYKDSLLKRYPQLDGKKIFVFPNVIDFSRFEKFKVDKTKQRDTRVTFFYFGVVAERRGIFDTLEVFERVLLNEQNVLLRIIGPVDNADKDRFHRFIAKDSLKNNIEYSEWIHIQDLLTELNRVDVCLAPFYVNKQHNSGVANKIFQYMYAEKPLIVSNCTPQAKLINDANCGLVYKSQEAYLASIISLTKQKDLRNKLGANAKKYLHDNYDGESHAEQLFKVYEPI